MMRCTMLNPLKCILALAAIALMTQGAYATTVDFEDLTLASESYWNGSDESGGFTSQGAYFVNRYNSAWGNWDGFAYSNTTDTTTAGFGNQYSAYTGSGFGGSGNYGVAYDSSFAISHPYIELPDNARIQSAHITNTTYAVQSMLHGDQFAKKFGGTSGNDADWFKLTITGEDADGNALSDSVEFYLADYRYANNQWDYIVDEWTPVNLAPLTGAKKLFFAMSSSDESGWGMNTPAYFAIDNVQYKMTTPVATPEPSSLVLLLSGWLLMGVFPSRRRRR